jgi:hypothetical protein
MCACLIIDLQVHQSLSFYSVQQIIADTETSAAGWRLPREVRVVMKNQIGVTGSVHLI